MPPPYYLPGLAPEAPEVTDDKDQSLGSCQIDCLPQDSLEWRLKSPLRAPLGAGHGSLEIQL